MMEHGVFYQKAHKVPSNTDTREQKIQVQDQILGKKTKEEEIRIAKTKETV